MKLQDLLAEAECDRLLNEGPGWDKFKSLAKKALSAGILTASVLGVSHNEAKADTWRIAPGGQQIIYQADDGRVVACSTRDRMGRYLPPQLAAAVCQQALYRSQAQFQGYQAPAYIPPPPPTVYAVPVGAPMITFGIEIGGGHHHQAPAQSSTQAPQGHKH